MRYGISFTDGAYSLCESTADNSINVPPWLVRILDRHEDDRRLIQDALRQLDNTRWDAIDAAKYK